MKKVLKYFVYAIFAMSVMVACEDSSKDMNSDVPSGKGGSMARFAILGNILYTVDNEALKVFDIADPNNIQFSNTSNIGVGIETIFPRGNTLFIGSSSGMLIFNALNPANPTFISRYDHILACDPVIADDNYAYVTLHSEDSRCGRTVNQLEVVDIRDLEWPSLVATYPMTSPLGLGKKGNLLFVCDKKLKVMDATDPLNIQLMNSFDVSAYDVIPLDTNLLLIGSDGLYQFSYNGTDLTLLSKIGVR